MEPLPSTSPRYLPHLRDGNLLFVHAQAPSDVERAIQMTGTATLSWLASHAPRAANVTTHETATHVAIAATDEATGDFVALEAVPPAVVATPMRDFLRRAALTEGVALYLAQPDDAQLRGARKEAVAIARTQVGKPYADFYQPPPAAFYCSSLVDYAFAQAAGTPSPFTFGVDFKLLFVPAEFWSKYYAQMNRSLPVNVSGSNPTLLLHSRRLAYRKVPPRELLSELVGDDRVDLSADAS